MSQNVTVSTIKSTFSANYTRTTTGFGGQGYQTLSLPGIPTDLINANDSLYSGPFTFLEYGTAFTDPYGNVIPSPTPVIDFTNVGIYTYAAITSELEDGSGKTATMCPSQSAFAVNADVPMASVYPAGYYLPDPSLENSFYEYDNYVPIGLNDFMLSNLPPASAGYPTWYSQIASGSCLQGSVGGQPTAHIPVNQLTADGGTVTITQASSPTTLSFAGFGGGLGFPSQGTGGDAIPTIPGGGGLGFPNQGTGGVAIVTSIEGGGLVFPSQGTGGVAVSTSIGGGLGFPSQGTGGVAISTSIGGLSFLSQGTGGAAVSTSIGGLSFLSQGTGGAAVSTSIGGLSFLSQGTGGAAIPTSTGGGDSGSSPTSQGEGGSSATTAGGDAGSGSNSQGDSGSSTAGGGGSPNNPSNTGSQYVATSTPPPAGATGSAQTTNQKPPPTIIVGYSTLTGTAAAAYVQESGIGRGAEILVSGVTLIGAAASAYMLAANAEADQAGMDITVGSNLIPYSTNAASQIVIGSQTLSPGAQVTLSGEPEEYLSLAPGGGGVVVLSDGVPITTGAVGMDLTLGINIIPYSTNSLSDVMIGTQTLSPGAEITASGGDVLSLAPGMNVVVYSKGTPITTEDLASETLPPPQPVKKSGAMRSSGLSHLRCIFVALAGSLLVNNWL